MKGKQRLYRWIIDEPMMTTVQIAKLEGINRKTLTCWFYRQKHDVSRVRNKLEEYRRKGKQRNVKLYPYRDGQLYPVSAIQKFEPHLSIPMIRQRYRRCEKHDWDSIFAPNGKPGAHAGGKINKAHLAGLGPRRDPNTIPGPTEYEKQLWG